MSKNYRLVLRVDNPPTDTQVMSFESGSYSVSGKNFALSSTEYADSLAGDRVALQDLYDATDGANWTITWNTTTIQSGDLSTLHGVSTDANGRVTKLELFDNFLVNMELTQSTKADPFVDIRVLDSDAGGNAYIPRLIEDSTHGALPDSLGNLTKLTWINLKWNYLTGQIPRSAVANWGSMRMCLIAGTAGPDGTAADPEGVPSESGNTTGNNYPRKRDWARNCFTGTFPQELLDLPNIEFLDHSRNYYPGENLPEITNTSTPLKGLYVSYNHFEGGLPTSWEHLSACWNLHTEMGSHKRDITDSAQNYDDIDQNLRLTGTLPASWGNGMRMMKTMRMLDNLFEGPFPDWSNIGQDNGYMDEFYWSNGNFGAFPDFIFDNPANFGNTIYLGLDNCNLTGQLPSTADQFDINNLNLENNDLSGTVPTNFFIQAGSTIFDLYNNAQLQGQLPDDMSTMGSRNFRINGCDFDGSLPSNWDTSASVSRSGFNFGSNRFSGAIPSVYGNLTFDLATKALRFNDNLLSGELPSSLENLPSDTTLEIQDNNFNFDDLIPVVPNINATSPPDFKYSPQNKLGEASDYDSGTNEINLSTVYTHVDNSYQWYLSTDSGATFSAITGETSNTLDTSTYNTGDQFYLEVTNTNISDLTLNSMTYTI